MIAKPAKKTNLWKIAIPIALLFLLICFCLLVLGLLVYFGYQGSGPLSMLATSTYTPSPTATFTPTRTATRTRTSTLTPITDLSGEWELTLTVTEVIPGGGISPSDPCTWYASLTHYLSITQERDGSLEATYYLSTGSTTYPLAGYFDGYYFNLTSSASGGSCAGNIITYEGILVGDILSGSKSVSGYTEGACCAYIGDFIGVRLP